VSSGVPSMTSRAVQCAVDFHTSGWLNILPLIHHHHHNNNNNNNSNNNNNNNNMEK